MSLTPLQSRLQQPDVASLDDARAADVLNAEGSGAGVTYIAITGAAIFETLSEAGVWGPIKLWSRPAPTGTVAAPSPQDSVVARCLAVVDAVAENVTLRTNREGVRTRWAGIFEGLRTDGLLTAGQRNSLNALAQRPATWAEENGYPRGVTARDIGLARGGK